MTGQEFPIVRPDEVADAIRFDNLIIKFGNMQVSKYKESHHIDKMIRQQLRRLGRFLLKVRKLDNKIKTIDQIYHPVYNDLIIDATNVHAGLSPDYRIYKTLSLALARFNLIKELG